MAGDRTTVRSPRKARSPRRGPPRVWVTAGAHEGESWELGEGEWIIGKADDARIRLTDSGVSRRHAKIVRSSDEMIVIIDLQSTNGTFVNDGRIEMAPLREGFRIGLGPDAELCFGHGDPPAVESPRPTPVASPLTRRELQVARLVARGLTNPQIADRLAIKAGTVSSHLDNVYARLRITSRAALTRWLVEAGLADEA